MSRNTKQTSQSKASLAGKTLQDDSSSMIAKQLAASALAQRHSSKQTSAEMEEKAARVLQSSKYSEETKALAGTVLAQANKARTT